VPEPVRIAMWSGPRNLSTAMMRSFSQRADCAVVDEPFYGAYLALTGIEHPMRDDTLAAMETDPESVANGLVGPVPDGKAIYYQKHMTHHMVDGVPRDWADKTVQVFLLRHPARVMASYAVKRAGAALEDLGFEAQAALFDACASPIVVDAEDISRDPEAMLRRLCDAIGVGWDPAMLSWPAGPDAADGVWGRHWYNAIWRSTGFAPWTETPLPEVTDRDGYGLAMDIYERLRVGRLRGD